MGTGAFAFSSTCSVQRSIVVHKQIIFNVVPRFATMHDGENAASAASVETRDLSRVAMSASRTTATETRQREVPSLSPEDRSFVSYLCATFDDRRMLEDEIAKNLDVLSSALLVALQMAGETLEWREDVTQQAGGGDDNHDAAGDFEGNMVRVGQALQTVLNARLEIGRDLLEQMLMSGEIRKLDALIGKSAREGKLDTSFFRVLSANLLDASSVMMNANDEKERDDIAPAVIEGVSKGDGGGEGDIASKTIPDKLQILHHIQTRCHEELEKAVPPGTGLLNKLLRTTVPSIRDNQLRHYLGPRITSITSPDGKVIDLHLPNTSSGAPGAPLVSHIEFGTAITDAITRIRTIEIAGGTDRLVARKLVEEVRQIAIEARNVLVSVNVEGEGSTVVVEYSEMLGPVFRPPPTDVSSAAPTATGME